MKRTTLLILLFTAFSLLAQDKFRTNSAVVNFEASVPFFEEVKAVNKLGTLVLEPETSTLICTVIIKDFRFKMDLMQEHFNDNYIESHRYPKAVFKGKIEKFDLKNIDETEKEYDIKGKLYLHGKSKMIAVKALMKRVPEGIQIVSTFPISVEDFNIEIPYVVANKISKTVQTDLTGIMK
ncbi:YceI-like domain-containing protein [Flavobacterium resistens]|uniref:YceI family protein n=1 Tax=Flavobacterium resistens TaxID=443612 RepID=A0A521EKS3_9FLAO|nr:MULTISPECIES: YceI family protein [Flavobacterium]MRX67684.1 YceI family protein [Flavobacterium resistens]SMO84514.1 YceI-like domain-containing protein [Flavobacterium resistens]